MTSAAVSAATTPLPRPRAISAPVEIEATNRILVVKRPRDCSGGDAFLWRQSWERLRDAAERGWPDITAFRHDPARPLWCSTAGHPNLVHGTPGTNLELLFRFPAGGEAGEVYTELVGKPGLRAFVTADIGSRYFLSVKFLNRP